MIDYVGNRCDRYFVSDDMDYYKVFHATASCVPYRRSGYQYFPDGHFDTGADTHLCAKTVSYFCDTAFDGQLDYDELC